MMERECQETTANNASKPECEKCCLKDICRTAREAAGQQAEP